MVNKHVIDSGIKQLTKLRETNASLAEKYGLGLDKTLTVLGAGMCGTVFSNGIHAVKLTHSETEIRTIRRLLKLPALPNVVKYNMVDRCYNMTGCHIVQMELLLPKPRWFSHAIMKYGLPGDHGTHHSEISVPKIRRAFRDIEVAQKALERHGLRQYDNQYNNIMYGHDGHFKIIDIHGGV